MGSDFLKLPMVHFWEPQKWEGFFRFPKKTLGIGKDNIPTMGDPAIAAMGVKSHPDGTLVVVIA
jgi:hypothetical protein